MPMPWSTMTSWTPSSTDRALTVTRVCGGEKVVAFSSSSAQISTMSLTSAGDTDRSSGMSRSTREYSSISARARRATSTRRTGELWFSSRSAPEITTRLSALRRRRLAMWSSRYSLDSRSGSASSVSNSSISVTWPPTRFWVRRPMCPNISATLRRLSTCRSTSCEAVVCTRSKARARSPISSFEFISSTSRRTGSAVSLSSSATRHSPAHDRHQDQHREQHQQREAADPVRDGQLLPVLPGDRGGDVVDQSLLDEAAEDAERQQGREQLAERQRRHRLDRVFLELVV